MTRLELEDACQSLLTRGIETIVLRMPGDPAGKRMRLIGHRAGPCGRITGWIGNDVVVEFDAAIVLDYLNFLPIEILSGSDHIDAELTAPTAAILAAKAASGTNTGEK